jgi:hypothetical protein
VLTKGMMDLCGDDGGLEEGSEDVRLHTHLLPALPGELVVHFELCRVLAYR